MTEKNIAYLLTAYLSQESVFIFIIMQVILPPTVPTRTTFANFMLSNKFEIPMHFKFDPPYGT